MPFTPYANQKTIRIHKPKVNRNFLQIPNEDWMSVNKQLGPYGLQLYLYLAANADDYCLNLSPQDAEQAAGIHRTTFYEYLKKLEIHGYLVWRTTNNYDFYTTPRPEEERSHPDHHNDCIDFKASPPCESPVSCSFATGTSNPPGNIPLPSTDQKYSAGNIVIDNIYQTESETNKYIDKTEASIRSLPSPVAETIIRIPLPKDESKPWRGRSY